MICGLCGFAKMGGGCPRCQRRYEEFCKNLPTGWQRLMGPAYSVLNETPQFHEWAEEQRIKKQRREGQITATEADKKAAELAERIRKKYNPTSEESIAAVKRIREQEAATKTFFDSPSLFD